MRSVLADLRHGLRLLVHSPLFTSVAGLSLALGIGANTAIFTVVNTLLLTPLPVSEPSRLSAVFTSDFSGPPYGASSYPDALDFARGTPAFSGIATARVEALSLTAGGTTERVYAEIVNPSYFDTLGLRAPIGRLFSGPDEAAADASGKGSTPSAADRNVVVLSHRFWTRRFAADPRIVGRSLILNGQALTVIGIADPDYTGLVRGLALDLWVPMTARPLLFPQSDPVESRGTRAYFLVARLAPDATVGQAQAQLQVLAARLNKAYPQNWTDVNGKVRRITVLPESEARVPPMASGPITAFLAVLLGIVGIVLLVACANVAGLLVGRAASRRREIAVRLALGAGRSRLIRQLLTESAVLALVGGVLGLLVARWTVTLISNLKPPIPVPIALSLSLDARVLAFAALVALGSGLLFGLAPALQTTRIPLQPALRSDLVSLSRSRRLTLRNGLVVSQVALSLLLLVLGGLFVRGIQRASFIDTGFDTRNVLTATIDPSMLGHSTERSVRIHQDILERVRQLPGVSSAAVARVVPLTMGTGRRGMLPEGYQPRQGEDMEEPFNMVSPGYFATIGLRLVRGRGFTEADASGAEPVIIVNEAFARRYWPGQDPLQKRVRTGDDRTPSRRVVGLAADAKYFSLSEEPRATLFLPFLQDASAEATLHVKTRGSVQSLVAPLREAVRAVDPALPILTLTTLEEQTSLALLPQRLAIRLIGSFGMLALLMAGIGLYGVLAQAVAQRTREIGIRIALGATRRDVVGLVLRHGLLLTLIGVVVGLAAAWGAARLVAVFLYGLSPLDPLAYAGSLAVLFAAALLAVWVPARKAASVDPVVALRYE